MTQEFLVCMRADAEWVAQGSSFNRTCSRCTARVMVAPSGQALLRREPLLAIVCSICYARHPPNLPVDVRLAGEPQQIAREILSAVPNFWRKRN